MHVVVAGVGNVLRGDDGFGVAVAGRLLEAEPPPEVEVLDIGIGGIHLVQDLLARKADVLIVIDAVDLGRPPGTVFVISPDVVDVETLPAEKRRDALADMHYATPERALMLARGLSALPKITWVVGCQPVDAHKVGEGLSPAVERAIPAAIAEVRRLLSDQGVRWPEGGSTT